LSEAVLDNWGKFWILWTMENLIAADLAERLDERPPKANPGVMPLSQQPSVAKRLRAIAKGRSKEKLQRLLRQAGNL
jgi:hypothetical protein